jgi:hypothetical protein
MNTSRFRPSSAGSPGRIEALTSVEGAILIWLAIGVGIAGGVFIIARSAIQIASVAYRVIEKEIDGRTATRQTTLLTLAMVAALIVTAVVAGYAILVMFATLLEGSGLINGT